MQIQKKKLYIFFFKFRPIRISDVSRRVQTNSSSSFFFRFFFPYYSWCTDVVSCLHVKSDRRGRWRIVARREAKPPIVSIIRSGRRAPFDLIKPERLEPLTSQKSVYSGGGRVKKKKINKYHRAEDLVYYSLFVARTVRTAVAANV